MFGNFDRQAYKADDAGAELPTSVIFPMLLWVYLFTVVIVLVNLLIAQMSATYQRVTEYGAYRWQLERAGICTCNAYHIYKNIHLHMYMHIHVRRAHR